ncbi:MAG TPA: hypothetical protein VFB90_03955 [Dehalococcoidia bacterium]|nr:hypothetical protein [Dehalococcoidia bacterium]
MDLWEELQAKDAELAMLAAIQARLADEQRRCGARKRNGQRCRVIPPEGRRHCPRHDTGPRTAEGKQRIREAQWKRWAAWRAARRITISGEQ